MVNPEKHFLDAHHYQASLEDEICAQVFMTFGVDPAGANEAVTDYLELRNRKHDPLNPMPAVIHLKNSLLDKRLDYDQQPVNWHQWRLLKSLINQSSERPSS